MTNLYFTGQVNNGLTFTGDGQASQLIASGSVAPAGPANSLSIGTVSSGTASATITGLAPAQTLNLTLPSGQGVPTGGTSGQVLSKIDATSYNTQWTTPTTSSGTVTSVAVTSANGVSGTVTNPSTTPAISLSLGAITPSSVAATGTVTGSNLSGTNTGDQTNITGTSGNITGTLAVAQGGSGATAVTGTGSNVLSTSPSLTTPKADFLNDTNGGKEIELVATASTANWIRLTNSTTGNGVTIGANGTGANENLTLAALGTGTVQVGGSQVTTAANTQTMTGKSISGATNTLSAIPESAITNLTTDLAAKQASLTLTTTGTSGAATLTGATLNIPQYSGGGGSGISRSITSISANTSAGATALTDYVYICTGSTGYTVTLPTAVGNTNRYTVKNGSTVTQSVATTSAQTIDGSASPITITTNTSLDLISDGTNWRTI